MARRWQGLLIVVLALGWWTAITLQSEGQALSRVPLLDERYYLEAAANPVAADQPYFMSPLYPRLIGLLGAGLTADEPVLPTGGRGLLVWFQGLLWIGAALLLRGCANRLLPDLPALWRWVPALLFLLYAPLLIYGQMALVEVPLVFLVTLFLFILAGDSRTWPWALALGLAVGLAALLRGSLLVLAVPAFVWLLKGKKPARRVIPAGIFVVFLFLVLLPPILHNSRLAGRPVGPTVNGGINLYLGQGPEATGLGAGFSVDWQQDPAGLEELSHRLGRPIADPIMADGLWAERARQAMAGDPGRAIGLWLKKWHLLWQAWEMDQITSLAGWREAVPWLRPAFLPWGVLVVLAAAGLATAGRRLILPAGVLLLMMAVQAFFFVVSRYRMALVPMLCLLAGAGLWALARGARRQRGLALAGLVLGMLLAWPWQLGEARARWDSLALANRAQRWAILAENEGNSVAWRRAAELYDRSLAGEPTLAGPWLGAAAAREALGDPAGATRALERGLGVLPRDLSLQKALFTFYLQAGKAEEALGLGRSLWQTTPRDAEVGHNLVVLLASQGQAEEAMGVARQMVRETPGQGQGYVDLGVLLARQGRREEAAEVFRQGLREAPGDGRLMENLHRLGEKP